jgi:hypothetical protein
MKIVDGNFVGSFLIKIWPNIVVEFELASEIGPHELIAKTSQPSTFSPPSHVLHGSGHLLQLISCRMLTVNVQFVLLSWAVAILNTAK